MSLRVGQEVTLRRPLPPEQVTDDGSVWPCDRGPRMGEVHRIAWMGMATSEGVYTEWLELQAWVAFRMPSQWFEAVVKPKREASTETGMDLLRKLQTPTPKIVERV